MSGYGVSVRFEAENLGPLSRVEVEVAPLTLFVGVNRAGKSIVARALAAITTALAQAVWKYASALASQKMGGFVQLKPLAQLLREELNAHIFNIPVRVGARSAVVRLVHRGFVLVVERDVFGEFNVEGDLANYATRRVEETLRFASSGMVYYEAPITPWTTLDMCNAIYPAAVRWLASTFDIVVMPTSVYEGGMEVRSPSSMVVSLVDLARRGGCRNLVLEEPEAHLHDDAVFELAKFLYAEASRGKGFLVTTHSDLLTAWIAALAAHPNPRELGVDVESRPEVRVYRFHLRRVGDAYVEPVDISGGEVDMDEAQLKVLQSLEDAIRAVRHALRAGR